jgi:hypothetical protein
VRHHLGIGLGLEPDAFGHQFVLELAEVLDDAVVHHRNPAGDVGMGVDLGRRAVRRPAGMADAGGAGELVPVELTLELGQLAGGPHPLERTAFENRDAGGVVAAILKPGQSLDEVRCDRSPAEDSNDSTHVC